MAKETTVTGLEKKELIAVCPVLFLSHQYKVGDVLPANYPDMVQAWLEAGTAVWKGDEKEENVTEVPIMEEPEAEESKAEEPITKEPVTAKPATAEPGLSGATVASEAENGENLVGKVPKTGRRKKE